MLVWRRIPDAVARAWAWFAAGFAEHPTTGEDDASYRWSLLWFRWGLTAAYVVISLVIASGQRLEWVIATTGYLAVYHLVGHTAHTIVHMRRGRPVLWFWEGTPFFDIVAVSLIMASVPSLVFPAWSAYLLVIFGASVSRRGSYVLTLTVTCAAGYAAVVASHLPAGHHVSWGDVATVSILLAFGGWFSSARARLERNLFEELREGEERYRSLVETSPDAITLTDLDGRILLCNEQAALLHGYNSEDDMLGREAFELIAPEDRPRAVENMRKTLELGSVRDIEYTMLTRDGRRFSSELSASLVVDAEGKPKAFIGVVRDITERTLAQKALRESEEHLRKQNRILAELANSKTPNRGDLDAAVREITEATAHAFGIERASVWLYNDDRSRIRCIDLYELSAGRHSEGAELTAADYPFYFKALEEERTIAAHDAHTDPRTKEFSDSYLSPLGITSMLDAPIRVGGHLAGVICHEHVGSAREWSLEEQNLAGSMADFVSLAMETYERKQAEEALRESEAKFRTLADTVGAATFIFQGTRVRYVNPAAEAITGHTRQELLAMNFWEVIHPDFRELTRQRGQARQRGEQAPSRYELKIVTKRGNERWLDFTGSVIEFEGKPAVLGTAFDVTERKRAEEAMRSIVEGTSSATGDDFFRSLVRNLASALGVRYALVAGVVHGAEKRARTLAMWASGDFGENFEYDLAGTPCENVVGQSMCHHPRDVQKLFPENHLLAEMEVESYLGVPLFDSEGNALGILAVLHDEPMKEAPNARSIMTIFAARAGVELERMRTEKGLRESEEKYRDLVENMSEVLYALDKEGRITYVSPVVEQIGGFSPEEIIGRSFTEFIHPDDLMPLVESFQRTIAGNLEPSEYRVFTKSGEVRWVRTSSRPVFEGDSMVGLRAVMMDITDRKQAEEALRESEDLHRSLIETSPDAVIRTDLDGTILMANRQAIELLGFENAEEVIGENALELVEPEQRQRVRAAIRSTSEAGVVRNVEHTLLRRDGTRVPAELSASAVVDAEGKPKAYVCVVRDITERKQAEETIRHLAYHDALTDLPNRTLFEDRLGVALAQARRKKQMAAVMFLDLDRFKVVNDTVGHALGDQLLQSVAERLTGLVRDGDTVARVGGDEFTLLLPDVAQIEDVIEVAKRIMETLGQPWAVNGHEFHVTASIGIAMCPDDGEDADSLLRNADTAMYRAKDQGRDNYKLYTPTMNARIAERVALETSLRRGLERGEFVVYYQPQVNLSSGQIVGVEALVRWQHPQRGLVLPADFIPVAEETGLIVPLGEWVLRTACAQNRAWQDAGHPRMRVAVNLSARRFQLRDLIVTVAQALAETGLDPHWLQLEITEGVAMQDAEFTIAMLRELREMGVQIAIDDFGTGHSSLSYLKRFPIDVVKIDRSFVRDLTVDPNDAAIATSIITMAHNLKLKVIAEGVETEEQLAFLKQRQCDEMQGYLFSRPVPAEAVEKMLPTSRRRSRARLTADSA